MKKNGKMLLITEVLGPLLEIVYLYKISKCYNYIPGENKNADCGWEYFEKKFNDIYKGLNQNIFLSEDEYEKAKTIITEMKAFVRSFSGVEGLPERYFTINPNLRFYRVAFYIQEDNDKSFYKAAAYNMLSYIPKINDFETKKQYFIRKEMENKKNNFHHDEDDYFMEELALTLRKLFISDFSELQE